MTIVASKSMDQAAKFAPNKKKHLCHFYVRVEAKKRDHMRIFTNSSSDEVKGIFAVFAAVLLLTNGMTTIHSSCTSYYILLK